jgi:SAM-dependent methyltransferase
MAGKTFPIATAILAAACVVCVAETAPRVQSIPYSDARAIFDGMPGAVPDPLRAMSGEERAAAWPKWVVGRNREIRARLEQGEEDTLTNFLLFGTSFTHQPRVTLAMLDRAQAKPASALDSESAFGALVQARAGDLATAAAVREPSERLRFAKSVIERNGASVMTASERSKAVEYLLRHLVQVLQEYDRYTELLKAAKAQGDNKQELLTRSTLFQARGVSLDTSWQPNFAIERSLAALKSKGLLAEGSVRRVAVIGPGLDFTDKEEGYDFYPPQTVQPYAVFDSLVRLGLARADAFEIATLDVSARVNDHIARARERAKAGEAYTIQMTLNPAVNWSAEAAAYWKEWGSRIGTPVPAIKPPAEAGAVETRALKIRPDVALRVEPRDLNVVVERLELNEPGEKFDLVIATNVLVYYDLFEQGLALQNIGAMLRPGGFFLSNDALVQITGCALHSAGTAGTSYSDRKEDADYMIWYRNQAEH